MNTSNLVVDLKHFEPNFYHVFYALVYAILNHSLLGELLVSVIMGRILVVSVLICFSNGFKIFLLQASRKKNGVLTLYVQMYKL